MMAGQLRSTARSSSYALDREDTSRGADMAALLVVLALLVGGVVLFLSDGAVALGPAPSTACASADSCPAQP
jgi:hypothetical protein